MPTVLAVLIRIVANPLSNVFQKQLAQRSAEPLLTIVATHGLLTVFALPILAGLPIAALGHDFWGISVYFGHRYFRERNIRRRVLGSLIMVIGAMLIVTLGHARG